jgi:hypothetical protein
MMMMTMASIEKISKIKKRTGLRPLRKISSSILEAASNNDIISLLK